MSNYDELKGHDPAAEAELDTAPDEATVEPEEPKASTSANTVAAPVIVEKPTPTPTPTPSGGKKN